MTLGLFRSFRLATSEDDDLHPSLTANGAFLGKSLVLLERDEIGRWRSRPQDQLEAILSIGYGIPVDLSRRMQSLETVAKALNNNDLCRATIALVQAQFPPLPNALAARRMVEADHFESVPGQHGLNYLFSERRLTLIQNDSDGGARLLFSGMPDKDGSYRDQDGTIVGRAVGNSFMLDNAGIAAMNTATSQDRAAAGAAADVSSDEPRLCPDPVPDRKGGMSERAADYQQQITGLPRGIAVELNGVMFDGCRTTDGTMLEAKGPGFEFAMDENGDWKQWYNGKTRLDEQIADQSRAAGERLVEWHVAEPRVAQYIEKVAQTNGYTNVFVFHTPAVTK